MNETLGSSSEPAEWPLFLLCRSGDLLCALPSADVIEIMRPLPIDPVPGGPAALLGVSIVRGVPVPVLALDRLLGMHDDRREYDRPDFALLMLGRESGDVVWV